MEDKPQDTSGVTQGVTPNSTTGTIPPSSPPSMSNSGVAPASPPTPTPEPKATADVPDFALPKEGPGQPPTQTPPGSAQVTKQEEKKSKISVVFIILIVLIILVWGVVFYLFFTNKNMDTDIVETSDTSLTQETAALTPTPSFNPDDIEIINGSVYQTTGGENTLLVNKEDYPGTGIAGFATVSVSPDFSLMCFEALPPALEPALYYSSIDGTGITEVSVSSKNCIWSNDSSQLAYVNDAAADVAVDIFKYVPATDTETNLTQSSTTSSVFRRYEVEGWTDDNSSIVCNYQEVDPADPSLEVLGSCEINVLTSEITDL